MGRKGEQETKHFRMRFGDAEGNFKRQIHQCPLIDRNVPRPALAG
jgi:hypothetical protein